MEQIFKLQSAMEYLMTYGWAILIIAVVLGALFSLGIFNPAFLAPKVQPGSCQVERPDGPGTTSYISLQGNCRNELPEYVAQFNGQSSYINTPVSTLTSISTAATFCAWINEAHAPNGYYVEGVPIASYEPFYPVGGNNGFEIYQNMIYDWVGGASGFPAGYPVTLVLHQWYQLCGTFTSSSLITIYFNGAPVATLEAAPSISLTSMQIGVGANVLTNGYAYQTFFNGSVANVQVYNTSLSSNEILFLYREGIGGEPINLSYLVGWWPLNGNANDYSGNENSGVNSNVIYTNGWTSGYTAP